MKRSVAILLWMPRVLAMALAVLLAMFAMDVFVQATDFWSTSRDFVTHLLPAVCVLAIVILGWRHDGLAALGFLALSVAYFVALVGWRHLPESLVLTMPPLGISLAYCARWRLLKQMPPAPD
jgi:cytochrome bd-type quinol oxidase subunit 2